MDDSSQFYSTGKRKNARARVFLRPGTGVLTVNGRAVDEYFTCLDQRVAVRAPFVLTETGGGLDAVITVAGGGVSAQAGAVRHGLARALCRFDVRLRPALKKEGLLTRDAREVERKVYGQPGSRKRFQFSKR